MSEGAEPTLPAKMGHRTFSKFVESPNDLVGLIAYALYKADKVAFCDAHPDADVNGFILTANLPTQVVAYRLKAEFMLEDMTEEALGEAVEKIEKEYISRARGIERALGFWRGVGSNIVANLAALAISILLVVLVFGNKLNFWDGLYNYFNSDAPATVKQKPSLSRQ